MKERLKKLIDVKSIVTLLLTLAFIYGFVVGKISGSDFIGIFVTVIAFYFGTQVQKNKENKDS